MNGRRSRPAPAVDFLDGLLRLVRGLW